jgi:hypothetical protein
MLKTVSSITNAIGALNYKGTWNASTNSPALASGVGTKGDYYVVSVAGATALDGISNWGVGDWAAYNGSVWQRVEGGADLNGVNLSVSGTSLLSGNTGVGGDTTGTIAGVSVTSKFCVKQDGTNPVAGFVKAEDTTAVSGSATFACRSRGTLTAPTVVQNGDSLWNMYIAGNDGTDLALAAEIRVEVDGTPGSDDMPGRIVFKTTPDGSQIPSEAMKIDSAQNVTVSAGNLVIGTSGKGIDFSATPGTGTSELLADYEEGTWTGTIIGSTTAGTASYAAQTGNYTKVGNVVHFDIYISWSAGTGTGNLLISGLPFTSKSGDSYGEVSIGDFNNVTLIALNVATARTNPSSTQIVFNQYPTGGGAVNLVGYDGGGYVVLGGFYFV